MNLYKAHAERAKPKNGTNKEDKANFAILYISASSLEEALSKFNNYRAEAGFLEPDKISFDKKIDIP